MSDTGAVERAARVYVEAGTADYDAMSPHARERLLLRMGAALAAAAPTVEEVAEVLYRADVPLILAGLAGAPEWKRREYMTKAEQVAALWGGNLPGVLASE